MKTDIREFVEWGMHWFTWTERCDACGKPVAHKQAGKWRTSGKPAIEDLDFCYDCLCFAIDNRIDKADIIEAIKTKSFRC